MEDKKPFIVILDWMYDLGLTSSEVLAVAIINGYTQDGTHTCHVSLSYFERRCCLSKQGVIDLLKRLEAKGVIKAERQSGRATEYTLNVSEEGVKKLDWSRNLTGQETTQKGSSFFTPLSSPHTPYLSSYNKDKKEINAHTREGAAGSTSPATEKEGQDEATLFGTEKQASVGDGAPQSQGKKKRQKSCAAPFVPPTLAEVREYIEKVRRSPIDPVAFFAHYENNDWRLSNGRRMKDWRLAVVTWERRDRNGWGR